MKKNIADCTAPRTYAIYGLTEFMASIPFASGCFQAHFAGGAISGYGVTPATYTTCDPVRQLALEKSHIFVSGRIKRLK